MLQWYNGVLAQYSRPLIPDIDIDLNVDLESRSRSRATSTQRVQRSDVGWGEGEGEGRDRGQEWGAGQSESEDEGYSSTMRQGQGQGQGQREGRMSSWGEGGVYSLESGPKSPHTRFRSGTDIFLVLYHFFGPVLLTCGPKSLQIDPKRVSFSPRSLGEMKSNVQYVFALLDMLQVDVLWTAEEWIAKSDSSFLILQLNSIHALCRDRQCAVPLADTLQAIPGVTSGPLGKPLVVGLIFADTPTPPPIRTPQFHPLSSSPSTGTGTGTFKVRHKQRVAQCSIVQYSRA